MVGLRIVVTMMRGLVGSLSCRGMVRGLILLRIVVTMARFGRRGLVNVIIDKKLDSTDKKMFNKSFPK